MTPEIDDLLSGMNPEQTEAILHAEGPMRVLAGAGSGKTRAMIHRIAVLVRRGVRPNRILAVTFSKNAQLEMERRGASLGLHGVDFKTWHSLALKIISKDATPWQRWARDFESKQEAESEEQDPDIVQDESIETERSEQEESEEEPEQVQQQGSAKAYRLSARTILKQVVGQKGMDWRNVDFGQLQQFIGFCKAWMWEYDSAETLAHAKEVFPGEWGFAVRAFQKFDEAIEQAMLLTYDDSLVKCARWLEQDDNADRWAAHWDYLLQDEAQDASPVQIQIASMLAARHRNYFVVGDPAQSVFGFRGSHPQFLLRFAEEWTGAKTVNMFRNYRCGSSIISLANAIIGPSVNRLPRDLVAECPWTGVVTHRTPSTPEVEASIVADSIQLRVANGSKFRDNVVLYRLNAQSRAIEEKLLHQGIPYYVVGGTQFYDRREVKSLLGYLRVGAGVDVVESMRRSINAPNRFLGREFVAKTQPFLKMDRPTVKDIETAITNACKHDNVNRRQVEAANEYSSLIVSLAGRIKYREEPVMLLRHVISKTGFEKWLRSEEGDETIDNNQVANVKELVRVSMQFSNVPDMLAHIEQVQKESKKQAKSKADRVLLMTLHRAKGLEWKHVHFIGAVEKIIPHAKAVDEDEERRLFYVGVTRAAESLLITSPQMVVTRSGVMPGQPSSYLIQAALQESIDLDGSEEEEDEDFKGDEFDEPEEVVPPIAEQTNEQRIARLYAYINAHGKK